jgi:L,D-peptidoglycan transpeptidase YkuD (ErfK/YbiS/YcfS/YnhG family)
LLDQRFAHVGIVVDDENSAGIGHDVAPRALIAGRTTDDRPEVDQSREKEQARKRTTLRQIRVRPRAGRASEGWLAAGHLRLPVALGSAGIRANKREGDGATPRGSFRLVRLWWRRDRANRPRTRLPVRRIGKSDAWCENPGDRRYNRPIQLAANAAGDRLWRNDHLYDFLIELDHNARPRVAGRGSAIFVHLARRGFRPTAGCVALAPESFRRLLVRLGPGTRIVIG